jgi:hypothetical protein
MNGKLEELGGVLAWGRLLSVLARVRQQAPMTSLAIERIATSSYM